MLSVIQSYEEQMHTRHLINFACNLSNSFIFCFDMYMNSQPYNSTDLHVYPDYYDLSLHPVISN